MHSFIVMMISLCSVLNGPVVSPSCGKPDRAVDEKQTESASNSEAMKLLQSNPSAAAEFALKKLQSEEGLSSTQRLQYLWIRGAGLSLSEEHTEALTALDEAAGMARQRSATKVLRMIVRYAAASAYELGQYDRGKALAEEGLAISARLGDTSKFTLNLHNELALNEAALGNLDTAIRHFRIAEQMATSTNDFKTRLKILSNLSQALDRARQHDEAIRLALQVIEEASPMQHGLVLATTRLNLADMYFRRGQSGDAKTMVNSALGEMPSRGSEKLHAQADAILGRIAIHEQRLSEGQELLKKARGRFEMLGDKVAVLGIDQELSVLTSSVSVDDQIEDLKKRISESVKTGEPELTNSLRRNLIEYLRSQGRWEEALETLEAVSAAEHEQWDVQLQKEVASSIADERFSRKEAEMKALAETAEANRLRALNSRLWIVALAVAFVLLLGFTSGISWHLAVKRKGLIQLNRAHAEIREQKRLQLEMERHLARQQKVESLGLMASGIAHDFNNLLSGIAGLAELGRMSASGGSKDDYFEQITSTSLRASGLTGQLLQFLGKPGSEKGSCDLSAVTLSVHALLLSLARPRHLILNSMTEPNYAAVSETQFQQVLINLVSNAAEATPADGEITISFDRQTITEPILDAIGSDIASSAGDYCQLIVHDNGKGLDSATRDRLFDPYFSTKALGRGLGLSSVLGIVRSSRGFVRVESEPGRGSTFIIYFPVAEPSVSSESVSKPVANEPVGETRPRLVPIPCEPGQRSTGILLVDDEVLLLRCIAEYLESNGYTVFPAESASTALEMLKEHSSEISCVVTDYSMPSNTGIWLAREIRKQLPELPIVLCSGFPEDNLTAESAVSALISKPFQPQQLLSVITKLLSAKSSQITVVGNPLVNPAA
jgi:signal transduction histidine kinase/ActR/RegA family two-component response regulator